MKNPRVELKTVYGEVLVELGADNPDIFVVEADLMKASGSKPFLENYPDRHINVGVAEQNLVGIAAGIAAAGGIPFACTMANFMAKRACDQVAMSVAYNMFNVKLVGCYAGLTQEKNGGTHISFMDIGVMRSMPGMTVLVPGDSEEFRQAVRAASVFQGPVYIRMPKLLQGSLPGKTYEFEIGPCYQYGNGNDLTIIATGLATDIALDSLQVLEEAGIAARVLHVPTIKPLDTESVIRCARETRACITIEDHATVGGLGGLIAETLTAACPVPLARIGMQDAFGLTADLEFQLEHFGITASHVAAEAIRLLDGRGQNE